MWCKALILTVFTLCLSIHQGEAIKCYTCSSATDPKCGDPIDTSVGLSECTPTIFKDATSVFKDAASAISGVLSKVGIDSNIQAPKPDELFACVKAVKKDGDKKLVARSCSIPKNDAFDFCKEFKASAPADGSTFCETCDDKDGCNTASGVAPSALLMLVGAAMVAYLSAKQ